MLLLVAILLVTVGYGFSVDGPSSEARDASVAPAATRATVPASADRAPVSGAWTIAVDSAETSSALRQALDAESGLGPRPR